MIDGGYNVKQNNDQITKMAKKENTFVCCLLDLLSKSIFSTILKNSYN